MESVDIYAVLLLVNITGCSALAYLATRNRSVHGSREFIFCSCGVVLTAIGIGLGVISDEPYKQPLFLISFLFLEILVILQLLLFLAFTGFRKPFQSNYIRVVVAWAVFNVILYLTNPVHHILFKNIVIKESIQLTYYWFSSHSIALLLFPVLADIIFVLGNFYLIKSYITVLPVYRKQILYIIMGNMFPLFMQFFNFNDPGLGYILMPLLFFPMGTMYYLGVFRFQILEIIPLSKNAIVDIIQDGVLVVNPHHSVILANKPLLDLLHTSQKDIEGKNLVHINNPIITPVITALESNISYSDFFLEKNGVKQYFRLNIFPLTVSDGDDVGRVITISDITEQKRSDELIREAEEKIRKNIERSLAEKEILLKEIHHRVKNNLQLITSMIRLQEYRSDNPMVIEILKASRSRIYSMALLHEKLYRTENLAEIPLKSYIRQISDQLLSEFASFHQDAEIEIECSDKVVVDIDMGVPIGLIINELMMNALKYAFLPGTKGRITIVIRPDFKGGDCLCISDNGIGLPEDFSFENVSSLGLIIVKNLVLQKKGTIQFSTMDGTHWTIQFPRGHFIIRQ